MRVFSIRRSHETHVMPVTGTTIREADPTRVSADINTTIGPFCAHFYGTSSLLITAFSRYSRSPFANTVQANAQMWSTGMSVVARAGRGGFVALSVICVSASSHLIAGGAAHLSSPLLLLVFAAIAALSMWLSRRDWSLPRFFALLVAAQVAVHFSMQWSDMAGMSAAAGGASEMMPASSSPATSWAMFGAHFGAVVVIALLLRDGESKALAVIAILAAFVRPFLTTFVAPAQPPYPVHSIFTGSLSVDDRWFASSLKRRGPPRCVVNSRPLVVGGVLA